MTDWRVTTLAELPSTMDWVREQALAGAPDFTGVRAVTQTGGRGRRGRVWTSPPGNLYFSFLVRLPGDGGLLPLALGLALHDALRPLIPPDVSVELKWPNDVLVDGRKISGILVEREGAFALVGIGVNIASAPEDRAALSEWSDMSVEAFLPLLQTAIGDICGQEEPSAVIDRWNAAAAWIGRDLTFQHGGNTLFGTFEGVDEQGRALLREGMETKAYASGEVMEVRPV